jgi:hypothetical protein
LKYYLTFNYETLLGHPVMRQKNSRRKKNPRGRRSVENEATAMPATGESRLIQNALSTKIS